MVGRIYKEDHYTLLHTKYESSLGLVVSEKKIFYVFPIVSLWEQMTPRVGPFLTAGAWLAGFRKRTTICCYIQNMKALGFVVSEKKFFYVFPMTPGTWLAGFMKRTTRHCYTQNMKVLGLVVSEKKIFFYVFPIVSLWELSVAMETRVLIRPGPKPNTTFPLPK